jgi:hypothetical protein
MSQIDDLRELGYDVTEAYQFNGQPVWSVSGFGTQTYVTDEDTSYLANLIDNHAMSAFAHAQPRAFSAAHQLELAGHKVERDPETQTFLFKKDGKGKGRKVNAKELVALEAQGSGA